MEKRFATVKNNARKERFVLRRDPALDAEYREAISAVKSRYGRNLGAFFRDVAKETKADKASSESDSAVQKK